MGLFSNNSPEARTNNPESPNSNRFVAYNRAQEVHAANSRIKGLVGRLYPDQQTDSFFNQASNAQNRGYQENFADENSAQIVAENTLTVSDVSNNIASIRKRIDEIHGTNSRQDSDIAA